MKTRIMAFIPTYFLVPNLNFKANTGPIALGNIIADPFRPNRYLTAVSQDELTSRYPHVEESVEEKPTISRDKENSTTVSIWAQFLQSVKVGPSGQHDTKMSMDFSMDSLTTRYFDRDPEADEIAARLSEPRVRRAMKADGLRPSEPIYMVTGLKIARGLVAKSTRSKGNSGGAELGGSVPTPAGDVGLGTNFNVMKNQNFTYETTIPEDIVFAYQLLQIRLKGWRNKNLTFDEFSHKAAFFSHQEDVMDDDDASKEEDENLEVLIEAISEADLKSIDEDEIAQRDVIGSEGDRVRIVMFSD